MKNKYIFFACTITFIIIITITYIIPHAKNKIMTPYYQELEFAFSFKIDEDETIKENILSGKTDTYLRAVSDYYFRQILIKKGIKREDTAQYIGTIGEKAEKLLSDENNSKYIIGILKEKSNTDYIYVYKHKKDIVFVP